MASVTPGNSSVDEDDVLNVSTPHVGDIDLLTPEDDEAEVDVESPRKPPSVAAAIAAFGGGVPTNKLRMPALSNNDDGAEGAGEEVEKGRELEEKPSHSRTPSWVKNAVAENEDRADAIVTTPTKAPGQEVEVESTEINDNDDPNEGASQAAPSPGRLPIVKVLEVENELRKRADAMVAQSDTGGLDKLSEHSGEADDSIGVVASGSMIGEAEEVGGLDGGDVEGVGVIGDGGSEDMEVSDSEADYNPEEEQQQQQHEEGGEEEEEEWEDFMAAYWQSTSNITPEQAKSIVLAEDTDLRPCAMEPELDEEPNSLSPIRTGPMDIGMDFAASISMSKSDDGDGMGYLSKIGLECTVAMARLMEENRDRVDGSDDFMEGLRIDVGRATGGMSPRKKSVQLPDEGIVPPEKEGRDVSPAASKPVEPPPTPPNNFDKHFSNLDPTLGATSTKSFESDAPDKRSAKSSTVGSDASTNVNAGAPSTDWKHKVAPLPSPDMIRMTGPIMTRTSLRSLVMKKWKPSYWMHYGPTQLLIFRSKDHMEDWRYNPYHGKKHHDFLVKLQIDFLGDMDRSESGKEGSGVLGHRVLPVKRKSYGKNEEEVYQFKLERWTNLGCSVLAAFASQDEDEAQILHDTITEILKSCPNNGLRNIDHMLK